MKTPDKESNKSLDDPDIANDTDQESRKPKDAGRRLVDANILKGRKLNLDRRVAPSDRRTDKGPSYKGPSRRKTIDKRTNIKDRRDKN